MIDGRNIFQGGFLGMDNIGVFDRSQPLPHGGRLEQADSTAWMAMYCLNMLAIALELARFKPPYADVASKFFEHFVHIARAINGRRGEHGLWDPEDNFYYDSIHQVQRRTYAAEDPVLCRTGAALRGRDAELQNLVRTARLPAAHGLVSEISSRVDPQPQSDG